ncbi:MAG: selenide, water dikinase SelD [Bradymonadaceae bacterium]
MEDEPPVVRDLVLVGGGHSHVAVMKMFGMDPIPGVRLTVVSRDLHTPYSGMLPGFIAGHYDFDDSHVDLRPLAKFADARLYQGEMVGLDLEGRRVLCEDRPPVAYDVLSINIGSTPTTDPVPGAAEHGLPVKPIDEFLEGWQRVRQRVRSADPDDPVTVATVGAGAGGTELTLATQYRLRTQLQQEDLSADCVEFKLLSGDETILPEQPSGARRRFRRILDERDVDVKTDHRVVEVRDDVLVCEDGREVAYDELFWTTSASAPDWIEETGLATDDEGFIEVDDRLQSTSHSEVFAAGDIASMTNYDLPASGVYAVRQGDPLESNLRRTFSGDSLVSYRPQSQILQIISTGDEYAVATRGWWSVEGEWVWKLKDWIDRRWMEKWRDLPDMDDQPEEFDSRDNEALDEISVVAMRCGGCGAKIGSTVLDQVLERLSPVVRDDVLVGLDEPDDAAVVEIPDDNVAVHTVDFFRSFVDDPYLFGRIASNHALGDIFAMNAEPQSALALCTVAHAPEEKVAEQLYQMMAGATAVLEESGTALVGGHSAEGEEMAFGLEVNGVGEPDRLLRKGGLRPGERLILTKPLGTGTLFAADMRQKARARWIDGALDRMAISNQRAGEILADHGAAACTDVTGFGVLGHLVEMTRPSEVDAVVDLDALPVLDGAMETLGEGIFSSLQPENVRLRRAVRNQEDVLDHQRYPLLFDPQTAGGLLAGVPEENAGACLEELRESGYPEARIVGRVEPMSDELEPIRIEEGE